jgi:FkbM family methyltransferase
MHKTHIREFSILVDTDFEEQIGLYGKNFWRGISSGVYESDTFDFIEKRANEGSRLFIDVGSATGCMVLYASALKMKVIGTEPQNLVFEALQRNISLNPDLAERILVHHCLVGSSKSSTEDNSEYFTPGANGPIEKAIVSKKISLEALLHSVVVQDKVSLKVDIEGAEFPLLSDVQTLRALKNKDATMYLSFHPGFTRVLSPKPTILELFKWRVLTLIETYKFVFNLRKFATITLLKSNRKLGTFNVIWKLFRDQKDFVLSFGR